MAVPTSAGPFAFSAADPSVPAAPFIAPPMPFRIREPLGRARLLDALVERAVDLRRVFCELEREDLEACPRREPAPPLAVLR